MYTHIEAAKVRKTFRQQFLQGITEGDRVSSLDGMLGVFQGVSLTREDDPIMRVFLVEPVDGYGKVVRNERTPKTLRLTSSTPFTYKGKKIPISLERTEEPSLKREEDIKQEEEFVPYYRRRY